MDRKITILKSDLEGFEKFLIERENTTATIKKYLTDIKCFYRYLEGKTQVKKTDLLEYKQWLMQKYAVTSANSMIVALNQYLVYKNSSHMRIRRIKIQKQSFLKEEKILSKKEYKFLVEEARRLNKKQLALIMETIASTGIRISELSSFTIESVRRGRIDVFNKGKNRVILLPKILKKKLLYYALKNDIKKGEIFITKKGKTKNRSNIWREMKRLCRYTKIKPESVFPHNLRHLFARCYYQQTKDLAGLADLLGHSSLEVTRIYTIKARSEYQKRIESLGLVEKYGTT